VLITVTFLDFVHISLQLLLDLFEFRGLPGNASDFIAEERTLLGK